MADVIEAETPTAARSPRPIWQAMALLLLVVATWSSATVATKYIFTHHLATGLTTICVRFTLAALVAFTLFSLQRRPKIAALRVSAARLRAYALGAVCLAVFFFCLNIGLIFTSAAVGGLIFFSVTPITMVVLGRFWLGVAIRRWQVWGIGLACVGLVVVLTGGDLNRLAGANASNPLLGDGLVALGGVGWGAYGVWGKRYLGSTPALLATGINQLGGVLLLWPLALTLEPGGISHIAGGGWLLIVYMGIVPSALGFAIFYQLLRVLTVSQAAVVQLLSPVITACMAFVWLDETIGAALVVGTLIILAGVRLSQRAR